MKVLKRNDRLGLRLEFEPEAERKYRVVVDEEVVYATNVDSSALSEYADIAAERDKPFAERRKREADFKLGQALQNERVARTSGNAAKTSGGKGGRGGV
ncbi:hypothetical protein [Nocardioides ochotonae]|uniref:hypothetical protein n=1 Tax=Nocardioides ochotonae TaxID=2685869 RepID=UPI00140B39C3|nr:hypothetical protein [Nocardioides ochotonae]